MKIRPLTSENHPKVSALLRQAFPGSTSEQRLVDDLYAGRKITSAWVCLQVNTVIACIVFSNAYNGTDVCGLHLAPLAVKPDSQRQGIGSELLRFALRQEIIKDSTIFVLGHPGFYHRFGFARCSQPLCPFDRNNAHFSSIRSSTHQPFTVGYEPEFYIKG